MREPPHSIEAEAGVLGSILLDSTKVLDMCADNDVTADSFYTPNHRHLFEVLNAMQREDNPIDLLTTGEYLKKAGRLDSIGGYEFLEKLVDNTPTAAHAEYYIGFVKQKELLRGIIDEAGKAIDSCYAETDEKAEAILARVSEGITNIAAHKEDKTVADCMDDNLIVLDNAYNGIVSGVPVPWPRFSNTTGGFQRGSVIPFVGRDGKGKCFAKGTEIRMHDGTTKQVQDIVDGELVMGWDSRPRRVLGTTSGIDKMYMVKQNDGTSFVCNGDHILVLKATGKSSVMKHLGEIAEVSVDDWLGWAQRNKHNYMSFKTGVIYGHRNLEVEPYFLGLWLGDGRKRSEEITSCDDEVIHYLSHYANRLGLKCRVLQYENSAACRITITNGCMQLRSQPLVTKLRKIGVINNKHIPHEYMTSSMEQRLKVLAGLIDSDGWAGSGNSYVFTNTDHKLALQVVELSRSLGFRTKMFSKKAHGFGVDTISHNVTISGFISDIPVRVKRKIRGDSKLTEPKYGITVTEIGTGEYFGFHLDGDHKFLLADYTVTHNSGALAQCLDYWAGERIPTLAFSLEDVKRRTLLRMGGCREWYSARTVETGRSLFNGAYQKICEPEWQKLREKMLAYKAFLEDKPFWIIDTPMNVEQICYWVKHYKRIHDIQVVTIDGFKDIVHTEGKGRTEKEAHVAKQLQAVAKLCNVAMPVVSHINKIDESSPISKIDVTGAGEQMKGARQVVIFQDAGVPLVDGETTFGLSMTKANFGGGGTVILQRDESVLYYEEEKY